MTDITPEVSPDAAEAVDPAPYENRDYLAELKAPLLKRQRELEKQRADDQRTIERATERRRKDRIELRQVLKVLASFEPAKPAKAKPPAPAKS